jgi:ribosomal protein L10
MNHSETKELLEKFRRFVIVETNGLEVCNMRFIFEVKRIAKRTPI